MNFKYPTDEKFYEGLQAKRNRIEQADLILGIHQRGCSILFGRERLNAIIASGMGEPLATMRIKYDSAPESSQLEILCAFLIVVKGSHEYESSDDNFLGDGQHKWSGWIT